MKPTNHVRKKELHLILGVISQSVFFFCYRIYQVLSKQSASTGRVIKLGIIKEVTLYCLLCEINYV
jgi:hypothetical protein